MFLVEAVCGASAGRVIEVELEEEEKKLEQDALLCRTRDYKNRVLCNEVGSLFTESDGYAVTVTLEDDVETIDFKVRSWSTSG